MSDKVSIIIPTYNRAHLISETLESIIAQTYENWEAIVIDDVSDDHTDDVMNTLYEQESRIKYLKRPESCSKGANACRNIGLAKATGDYIVFFDSDDLMTTNHLELKVTSMKRYKVDFIITKTTYFNNPDNVKDHEYKFDRFLLNLTNYLAQNINWLTLDICLRATVVSNLCFNEELQSGQEFNFYAKLLAKTEKGVFVPKTVSLRRYHANSIQNQLKDKSSKHLSSFRSKWNTYLDIEKSITHFQKQILIYKCLKELIQLKQVPRKYILPILFSTFKIFGYKAFYFLGFVCLQPLNKGYYFINKLNKMGEKILLKFTNYQRIP